MARKSAGKKTGAAPPTVKLKVLREGSSKRERQHRRSVVTPFPSRKSALIVLGMHRSGTSPMTRVLNLLGGDLPSNLMPPAPGDNELGFWEPDDIVRIHDELLSSAGSSWDDVSPFPESWYGSNVVDGFRERILHILERDFSRSAIFVLKDPRICRLLPFWLTLLEQFGADPRFIIVIRNPLEVAASLKARNHFLPSKSILLWLWHLLEAERETRGRKRSFTFYEDLLEDWSDVAARVSKELDIPWPRLSHETSVRIEEFLSSSHRHHSYRPQELAIRADVADWAKHAYHAVLTSWESPRRLAKTLDEIRRELNVADAAFGPLIAQARIDLTTRNQAIETLTSDLGAHQKELAEKNEEIVALSGELETRDEKLAGKDRELAGLSTALSQKDKILQEQHSRIVSLSSDLEARDDELVEKSEEIVRLSGELKTRDENLAEKDKGITRLSGELKARDEKLAEKDKEIVRLSGELKTRDEKSVEKDKEIVKLSGELKTRDEEWAEKDKEIVKLSGELKTRDENLAEKDKEIVNLSDELKRRHETLRDKTEEILQLSSQLKAIADLSARREQVLQSVLSSRSWRATRPLRSVSAALRSLRAIPKGMDSTGRYFQQSGLHTADPRPPVSATSPERQQEVKDAYHRLARVQLDAFLGEPHRLQLPFSEKPEVSILLVLHNQAALTLACLQSIREAVDCPAEVIIIDNASTDETHSLLDRVDSAEITYNAENVHFLRACNQGAPLARGRFILLLNNDARLLPGSLRAALSTMNSSPDIGVVGGRLVLLDGSLQEAGSIVWRDGSCLGYGRGDSPSAPMYSFRRDVDFCSGAFFLVRRELFNTLEGFDDAFAPAYYEEVDFCLRARRAGFRTVYEPAAVILHCEFASSADYTEVIALQAQNRKVLVERHEPIRSRQAEPTPYNLLWARSVSKCRSRILLIENRVPHPGLGQGYPRSQRILATLVDLGHFVTIYPLVFPDEPWEKVYADIPREVEVMNGWGAELLPGFLKERSGFYDTIVVCRPPNMATYLHAAGMNRNAMNRTRIIYDAEAVFAFREVRRLGLESEESSEKITGAIAEEMALAKRAEAVLTVCEMERKAFLSHGVEQAVVLGHSLTVTPTPNDFVSRRNILFVGAILDEQTPNGESLIWFVENVFPIVQEKLGRDIRLLIAGINDGERFRKMASETVRILGFVDDLKQLYDACRIFVAPTRFSAGIPLKVYEAAAHGLPSVTSSLLASQLDWESEQDLLAAEGTDAKGFAEACLRLYSDESLWWRLRESALARVERECSPEVFRSTLEKVFG